MAERYRAGETLQQIGDTYGLTRERVRQLLAPLKVSRSEGGVAIRRRERAEKARQERDNACITKWGHTRAAHRRLLLIGRGMAQQGARRERTPIGAFIRQRANAEKRGVGWELTLAQWWSIWEASKKWGLRGRGVDGYVMSRYGDTGPYAVGNVFIQRATDNSSDQPQKKSGLPKGVTKLPSGRFTAHRMIRGVTYYLGTHDTPEEAAAAYEAGPLNAAQPRSA